jgi:hypothetical protein
MLLPLLTILMMTLMMMALMTHLEVPPLACGHEWRQAQAVGHLERRPARKQQLHHLQIKEGLKASGGVEENDGMTCSEGQS